MKPGVAKNNVTASYVIPQSVKDGVIELAERFDVSSSRIAKQALAEFYAKNKNKKPRPIFG